MIIKSISHEQRRRNAADRAKARADGREPALKRIDAKAQAAHVIAASNYMMKPSEAKAVALGIEDHLPARTAVYMLRDDIGNERVLKVAHLNFKTRTLAEQQAEMLALMSMTPGHDDPFEHLMLSPGHGIEPTEQQMRRVPARLLELLGTASHLAFVVWHADTDNIHAHIGLCRVDPDTGARVQLGDGWLLDTLAQARAQIEYEQGWPSERDATYRANARGVFLIATGEQVRDASWNIVNRAAPSDARRAAREATTALKISDTAREHERRQHSWSDERAAQRIAWPIIRDAQSWAELHRKLAAEGMRYEQKGSGARLHIGERDLVATKANGAASIAKRRPTLGPFEPRAPDVRVATYVPRRLEGADTRDAYRAAKAEQAERRLRECKAVDTATAAAKSALHREHQRLQQRINMEAWSGRGDELSLARKLAGAVYRDGCIDIDKTHRSAQHATKLATSFPRFERWLRERFLDPDDDDEETAWTCAGTIVGSNGQHVWPAILWPDYDTEDDAFERRYLKDGKLRFVDRGNRIDVVDALDRDTVRHALLLASDKWNSVLVTGDRRFRELAADVAAELDIDIVNPDLQSRIERERRRWRQVRAQEAERDARVRQRAESLIRQWPLIGLQDGKIAVSAPICERYGLKKADIETPIFQAVLREHLAPQKRAFDAMRSTIAARPQAFRDRNGKIALPLDDGDGAMVRRQNWSADPGFMTWLGKAVASAEAAQKRGAASPVQAISPAPLKPVRQQQDHRATPAPQPNLTPGWNGRTLSAAAHRAMTRRVAAYLAADDWDPADYRSAAKRRDARRQREAAIGRVSHRGYSPAGFDPGR